MSISVPLVWPGSRMEERVGEPIFGRDIEGHLIFDGGLLAGFPIHYLLKREDPEVVAIFGPAEPENERPAIIGLLLDDKVAVPGDVAPIKEGGDFKIIDRINRLLGTMSSWQAEHLKGAEQLICHIGVSGPPPPSK